MKDEIVTKKHIDELRGNNYLFMVVGEEVVSIDTQEEIVKAAQQWNMSPLAVEALKDAFDFLVEDLHEKLSADLQDIWEAANSRE